MLPGREIDREVAAGEPGLLPRLDPAEGAIGDHHHCDRQAQPRDGLQLAGCKAEAAVPHDRDAFGCGPADLGADRGRQRVAERAVRPVGNEVPAGLPELIEGRKVGAGRAGIGHDQRIPRQQFLQRGDDALGANRGLVAAGELRETSELLGFGARHELAAERPPRRRFEDPRHFAPQRGQRQPGIPDHRDLRRVVDPDHRRVDVDVHDAHPVGRGMPPALGGDRPGAAADEHDHVRFVDQRTGFGGAAVAADHAERQRMILGDAALAADGGGDGRLEQLGQLAQFPLGTGHHRATAADEQRALGGQDRLRRRLDRRRLGRRAPGGIGAERGIGVHRSLVDRVLLDVERQPEMHGAGPAGGHVAERRAHGDRDLFGAVDHLIPLGQRAEQRLLVQLGQHAAAPRADGDVRRDGEYRDRGLVGLDHAGQDVGGATAGRPLAHPDPAGDPCVGISHVRGRALVAGQQMGDAVVEAMERIVERQAGVAAQAEDVAHAVQLQHAHQRLRPGQSVHPPLRSAGSGSLAEPAREHRASFRRSSRQLPTAKRPGSARRMA